MRILFPYLAALSKGPPQSNSFTGQGCFWCEIVDFPAEFRADKKCAGTVDREGCLVSAAAPAADVLAPAALAVADVEVLPPFAAAPPVCRAHSRGRSRHLRVLPAPLSRL